MMVTKLLDRWRYGGRRRYEGIRRMYQSNLFPINLKVVTGILSSKGMNDEVLQYIQVNKHISWVSKFVLSFSDHDSPYA